MAFSPQTASLPMHIAGAGSDPSLFDSGSPRSPMSHCRSPSDELTRRCRLMAKSFGEKAVQEIDTEPSPPEPAESPLSSASGRSLSDVGNSPTQSMRSPGPPPAASTLWHNSPQMSPMGGSSDWPLSPELGSGFSLGEISEEGEYDPAPDSAQPNAGRYATLRPQQRAQEGAQAVDMDSHPTSLLFGSAIASSSSSSAESPLSSFEQSGRQPRSFYADAKTSTSSVVLADDEASSTDEMVATPTKVISPDFTPTRRKSDAMAGDNPSASLAGALRSKLNLDTTHT